MSPATERLTGEVAISSDGLLSHAADPNPSFRATYPVGGAYKRTTHANACASLDASPAHLICVATSQGKAPRQCPTPGQVACSTSRDQSYSYFDLASVLLNPSSVLLLLFFSSSILLLLLLPFSSFPLLLLLVFHCLLQFPASNTCFYSPLMLPRYIVLHE